MPMMNEPISKKYAKKDPPQCYEKEGMVKSGHDWSSKTMCGGEKGLKSGGRGDAFGPLFKDRAHFNSMHFN